ncbi:Universal stress protein F [Phycisphaerales bacterium]|nr:Universal stress protein F [Phycisphaerales bacterium]
MITKGSIVVGMDFSACSASALAQALRMGAWTRSPVHALHVIDTLALTELEVAYSPLMLEVHQQLKDEARSAWGRVSRDVPGAAQATFEVITHNPLTGLVQACKDRNAGLLCLGIHGDRAHRGVGTLAGKCARSAPTDVLLVEEGKSAKFRTIVACIDFSETSRRALERAMQIAAQDGAQVHALHVYRAPWSGLHVRPAAMKDDPGAQARYREILRENLEKFCRPTDPAVTWTNPRFELLEHRSHGAGIAEYVRASGAELCVLGTRGKTNLRDVMLGSTAERVVREAPCSTLVVRPVE